MDNDLLKIIIYIFTGGFLSFLALTIVRDNLGNRLNRVTGAMLLFVGLGSLFLALAQIIYKSPQASAGFVDSTLFHLQHIWEFFFPLFLLFSWIFPEDRLRDFRHRRLRYLIFIPQLTHLLLMLLFTQFVDFLSSLTIEPNASGLSKIIMVPMSYIFSLLLLIISFIRNDHIEIFGLLNILYVVTAVYFLETSRKLVTNPRLLAQTRIVFRGIRACAGIYTVTFIGSLLFPKYFTDTLYSISYILSSLLIAGIFAYTTIRYQLLDVRLKFRQSFVYTITSALLVGVYIILVLKSESILKPIFGAQTEVLSYAFIIILLLLFQPINGFFDSILRSIFIRTRTDHGNIIERFSRQVISLFDPKKLRQIIEETLKTSLLVEKVFFILYDDEINEYAILQSDDFPRRVPLDRDDLMLRGINLLDSPTYLYSLSDYTTNSHLANTLSERKVRLILPMKDANHMLGFLALTDKVAGYSYSTDDFNLLGVLSNQMVTALTNARLYVDSLERTRLQEEVSMARQIQLDLLPSSPPIFENLTISVHSTPSRTVGGDFYDFIKIDENRLGIVIADASGKGMPAALMIAQTQAIIHSEVRNGNRISKMMKNMNQLVAEATSPEKYVTLFYGELDTKLGEFHYCNAGHNYPILARANGDMELLTTGGPIIGALLNMEYTSTSVRLEPNDILFLYTDGLSEAMDKDENEFGEQRLRDLVCQFRHHNACDIMDNILNEVKTFDGTFPPRDDTTIISLKINGKMVASNV